MGAAEGLSNVRPLNLTCEGRDSVERLQQARCINLTVAAVRGSEGKLASDTEEQDLLIQTGAHK